MTRNIALSLLLLLVGSPLLAQAGPVGPEFRVNTTVANHQRVIESGGSVACDDSGNFVVVWTSTGQDSGTTDGVYGQRYSSAGVPLGGEFLVNVTVTDAQRNPAVAMDADGDFVVVWQNTSTATGVDIYGRRYNSAGVAQGGEFKVNTFDASQQLLPTVAMDAAGNFVVVWDSLSNPDDNDGAGIYAQRYSSAGTPLGGEFRVNTVTANDQKRPAVAMDVAGNFVVVWASFGQDFGGTWGIYGQRYTSAGAPAGSEFPVNLNVGNDQDNPAIAMEDNGDFVVVYTSMLWDGNGNSIAMQRFTAAGATVGGEVLVNSTWTGNQESPVVAMDADGEFVVAWSSDGGQDGDLKGIYAQRYTKAGVLSGPETLVNTYTTSDQMHPGVTMYPNGDYVVVWQSLNQDTHLFGIYGQRFNGQSAIPVIDLMTTSATYTEDDPPVLLAPAATLTAFVPNLNGGVLVVNGLNMVQDSFVVKTTSNVRRNGTAIEFDASGLFGGGEIPVGTSPTSGPGSGAAATELIIGFNASCTPAIAEAVIRSVAYVNTTQNPSQALRTFTFTISDGAGGNSAPVNMNGTVVSVFDAPTLTSFTLLFDNEDNPRTITFVDLEAAGDEADVDSSPVYFRISSLGGGTLLLNGLPAAVGADVLPGGTLLWTPPADANGTQTVAEFVALDAAVNTLTSATPVALQVSLAAVNDAPAFVSGGNPPDSYQGAGPQTVSGWATLISPGPPNESSQLLQFNVSVTGTTGTLGFSMPPAVDAVTGNLTYTATGEGTASVQIELQDDGGIANGGVDKSGPVTVTVTVLAAPTVLWVDTAFTGLNYGDDPPGPALFFGIDAFVSLQDAVNAAPSGATINLGAGVYPGAVADKPIALVGGGIPTTTIRGASPALTVNSPGVSVSGVTLEVDSAPTPNDPTVLILSGDLSIDTSLVHESATFAQAAVRLTGGTITFGAGVTLNRQGTGLLIDNQTAGAIDATAPAFQDGGGAFAGNFAVEDAIAHAMDNAGYGLVTWVSNNLYVTTGTLGIQRAVDAASAGNTVNVGAGTYNGAHLINKSVTLAGPNAGTHGTSGSRVAEARVGNNSGSVALFVVSAPGVLVDGLEFYAFDTFVTRCITTSGNSFSGLTVRNCVFRRDATAYPGAGFGAVYAIEAQGNGTQGVDVLRNLITGTANPTPPPAAKAAFFRGVYLRLVSGTVGGSNASDGNTIAAYVQDVLVQFGGNVTLWHNSFDGAGVDISEPGAGASIQIQENTFNLADPQLPQGLLVKYNPDATAGVAVTGNTFNNHAIGAVIAAARNVVLDGNIFNNAATVTDFTHVLFSTSWPTSGTPAAVTGCGLDLRNNQFNFVAGPAAGRALDFQNGNSASSIGAVVIGPAGNANSFDGNLPQYIRLQTSALSGPLFSPASNPAPAAFSTNLDASNNSFAGVGPGAMSQAQRLALEGKVHHKVDDATLGLVGFGYNNAPTLINGPFAFSTIAEDSVNPAGDPIDVSADLIDVDGPGAGIAVFGANNSGGDWQYSLNNGASWTSFGSISPTSAVLLASNPASTRIRFVPAANFFGTSSIQIRGWDQSTGSDGDTGVDASSAGIGTAFSANSETVSIIVTAVNDAPGFAASNPPVVNEDAGAQTVSNWALFNPGPNEGTQSVLAYSVSNLSNPGLFLVAPAVANNGTLTYTPAANLSGTCTFDVTVQDDGGTPGVDTSVPQSFTITVNAVNDAPSWTNTSFTFTSQLEDAANNGDQIDLSGDIADVDGPATGIALYDADNSNGQWQFTLTGGAPWTNLSGLSPVNATLIPGGSNTRIRFVPNADYHGTAAIQGRAWDLSSGAAGQTGVDVTSNGGATAFSTNTATATITILPVNDAPTFTPGADPATLPTGAGAQVIPAWATAISPGAANESGQNLAFSVIQTGGTLLFSVAPAVSAASGNLTFTPDPVSNGTATFQVTLADDGGTSPGFDTSAPHTLTITVAIMPPQVWVDAAWSGMNYGDDPPGPATFFGIDGFALLQDGVNAVNTSGTVHVAAGNYVGAATNRSMQLNLSTGPTLRGASPVLSHSAGTLTVTGGTLDQNTAFPTILLTGGTLILSGVLVQESSVANNSCIEVTGGTLDLAASGGNTLQVRGAGGSFINNIHSAPISAIGAVANTWQEDATTFNLASLADNFAVEDRTQHATDAAGRGFIRWVAGNVYVTSASGSIQRGVNAAAPGDTLNISAGEFAGTVIVDRTLTVLGAQAGQNADVRVGLFSGGKASTASETVVTAASNNPTGTNPNAEDLVRVLAADVTLDGLVLDGNNPALGASSLVLNGVDIHARRGVTNVNTTSDSAGVPVNNLLVRHCVMQNLGQRGVSWLNNGPVTHGVVRENVIRNFYTHGIIMFTNAYLDVEDNTIITGVSTIGIHWQNFHVGRPGNAITHWRNNRVTVGPDSFGIHQNMSYSTASPLNIEGNTVNADAAATFADAFTWGINVWVLQNACTTTIVNNTVGASGGQFARGINLWYLPTTSTVTVSGGSVANAAAGIQFDNVDLQYLQAADSAVQVNGVTVSASCQTGVLLRSATVLTWDGSGLNTPTPAGGDVAMTMTGCSIAGSGTGIAVITDSTFTAALTVSGGSIGGGTGLDVSGGQSGAQLSGVSVTSSAARAVAVDAGAAGLTACVLVAATTALHVANGGQLTAFQNNQVTGWGTEGVRIESSAGSISALYNNSFTGSGIALVNLAAAQVDARHNWWGSPRGPAEASNPGGNGAGVNSLAQAAYTPWWASGVDAAPAAGFQGGDVSGSPSGEARHAIPTEMAWVQSPVSPQLAGVPFAPAPVLRAQDSLGILGFNFQGQTFLGFVSNPSGASQSGGAVFSVDGSISFAAFSVSLGGVYTFQATAAGPLAAMQSPVTGLVFINNPAPVLLSVVPDWANAGSGAQLLTLSGSGFNSQSVAQWNGSGRGTLFVNSNTLMMALLASDLSAPGLNAVSVNNGSPGGGTSANVNFTVNAVPSAINLSVSTVNENQPANSLVGTLSVTDAFPLADVHTLSLVFGAGAGGNSSFVVAGNQLRTAAVFDFEAQTSYSIRVRATDSYGAWLESILTITVNDVNEAPTAVADSYSGTEDATLSATAASGVTANDSDPEGTVLTALLVTPPAPAASVTAFNLNPDGSFSLTPAANFHGTITFSYQAGDGVLTSAPVVVSLFFASVNDAPVAANDSYSATEDTPLTVIAGAGVLSNDSDLHSGAPGENNTPLAAQLLTNPANGSVVLNSSGGFTYTPAPNFSGSDGFTYRTVDSLGGQSAAASVTITVAAANDAPALNAPSFTFNSQAEDDTAQIGDDIDLSGDITDLDGPGTGLAVFGADNSNGQWQFTLTGGAPWTNLTGLTATSAVLIPSGVNTRIRFLPNANFNGTAAILVRGWDQSTGTAGQTGVDVSLNGGSTAFSSNSAVATISITPVNDAPTLTSVATLTGAAEDTPYAIAYAVLAAAANESDIDSSPVNFRIESVTSGSLTINGGSVSPGSTLFALGDTLAWTPTPNANGVLAAFTVVAWDGALASAGPVQVSVSVTAVNDAPGFTKGADIPVLEDSAPFSQANWATAISAGPADEAGQTLTFVVQANTNPGLFSAQPAVSAAGQLTFTPAADANGTALVTLVLQDNGGGSNTSAPQSFSIIVNPVNDAPVLTSVSTLSGALEDTPYVVFFAALQAAANESDIDSATISFRIQAVTSGSLTINSGPVTPGSTIFSSGAQLEWTPAADANGVLPAFTIVAWDGLLASAPAVQVSVNVAAANDPPTLTAVSTLTGATEDTQFVIPFAVLAAAANEADTDSATVSFRVESVVSGSLTMNGSAVTPGAAIFASGAQLEWMPAANANGVLAAFTIVAWDGFLASAGAIPVNVNVTPVNDAPELRLPGSGSSFVDLGGGVFRLTIDPGALPADAVLEAADLDSATVDFAIAPPATLPAGITAPASNPTLAAGSILAFTGNSGASDPLLSPYQYAVTLAGAASPWIVQVVVNDPPPQHSVASGFGLGTAGSPYTTAVGIGSAPGVVVANVFELNTAQTISQVGTTLISPAGSPFAAQFTGTGSSGAIILQAGRTLNVGDVGNHDLSVTVTDGQTNVTIFVRATVLNVGNVQPASGLAGGSMFVATGADQFALDVDPAETLASAELVLTDADGDALTITSITATPSGLGGVTAPAVLVTALSPLAVSFTGTVDASYAPGAYVYTLVVTDNITAPVTVTVTITLADLAPEAVPGPDTVTASPGTGTSTDPFRVAVQTGHTAAMNVALISDPNTGQTLTLTGVNTSAQPLVAFDFQLVGTGSTGDIVITPNAPLGQADVGIWIVEFFITDGGANSVSVFVEITVTAAPGGDGGGGGGDDDGGCTSASGRGINLLWLGVPLLFVAGRYRRRKA